MRILVVDQQPRTEKSVQPYDVAAIEKLLNTSDGNLSVHARKLEEAEYISCEKTFEGRMPKTEYRMTAAGRRALERYLDEMEALIRTTRKTQR